MGFFTARRRKKAAAPSADGFPELRTGMAVEVLTPTGVSLFKGHIRLLGSDTLEVRARDGGFLPRAVYGQPVNLRGLLEDGAPFALDGSVGPNGPDFWRIERLRLPRASQHRDFFRQHIGADGYVCSSRTLQGRKNPCKVLDISGSGARVVTSAIFKPESTFQLVLSLLPGEPSFSITCLVKRVCAHSKPGNSGRQFEYGCQFIELSSKELDRLVQAVFTLQRETLRSRRLR